MKPLPYSKDNLVFYIRTAETIKNIVPLGKITEDDQSLLDTLQEYSNRFYEECLNLWVTPEIEGA